MPSDSAAPALTEDRCPGVLRLTEAADGWLARVRVVGGFLPAVGLSALADAARDLGDGRLELTSRGNVQLRGLAAGAGAELGRRLGAAGLWPSETHERVRNIVASPLAGLDREPDLTALVHRLDEALCAAPRLAQLSGRFLFAVDDGRGDVAGLGADVLIRDGVVNGLRAGDPVRVALDVADAFLDERPAQGSDAWRIADLVDGARRVRARVAAALPEGAARRFSALSRDAGPTAPGPFTRTDGRTAAVLAVPLGRLDDTQLSWLVDTVGALGDEQPARVTPWRGVVLPEAGRSVVAAAAALGFGVTPDTPWADVSACAGRPGCAKALADVQADARANLLRWPGSVVRWSGCERRCGRPANTDIDVVATSGGYAITGEHLVTSGQPAGRRVDAR